MSLEFLIIPALAGAVIWYIRALIARAKYRRTYIDTYRWPPGLLAKVAQAHPQLQGGDIEKVGDGLKQFFHSYHEGYFSPVSMPSQIADDLWHEFILYTRHYSEFCSQAFGRFLHHTPALVLMKGEASANEGLRRVWWQACKLEGIEPTKAKRLPLLFALDAMFNVERGFYYEADCSGARRKGDKKRDDRGGDSGGSVGYCGTDFTSTDFDGSTTGLGDGGGGDGGGCGGD